MSLEVSRLRKHHLSAVRSLWQTQSKILSKHHLSAARSLWQTQSKILSKHHLSAARSLWQTQCKIFSKHHLSAARSLSHLSAARWLADSAEDLHEAQPVHSKVVGRLSPRSSRSPVHAEDQNMVSDATFLENKHVVSPVRAKKTPAAQELGFTPCPPLPQVQCWKFRMERDDLGNCGRFFCNIRCTRPGASTMMSG